MKMGLKTGIPLSICLFFIISCSKHDDIVVDCISEVTVDSASMANQVTPAQLTVITNLFGSNNLSTAGEQFFAIDSNRYQPPGFNDSVSQVEVLAYRWYNDLPVFMWNDNLVFYNDVLQPISIMYKGQAPGPDTSFRQPLESLRRIFQANTGPHFLDSCLTAQPGYIDAHYFNPASPSGSRLIKAWKVTPVGSVIPMVLVADSTGAARPVNLITPNFS
jgi:hypothetical protein